jgi:hypothetical protein
MTYCIWFIFLVTSFVVEIDFNDDETNREKLIQYINSDSIDQWLSALNRIEKILSDPTLHNLSVEASNHPLYSAIYYQHFLINHYPLLSSTQV